MARAEADSLAPSQEAIRERLVAMVPLEVHPAALNLQLWGRRILVLQVPPEQQSQGGIYIPPTAQRPMSAGWIVGIGPDVGTTIHSDKHGMPGHQDPWSLIGRKAIFGDYVGFDIHFKPYEGRRFETDYLMMTEYDIWAIEEPEEKQIEPSTSNESPA